MWFRFCVEQGRYYAYGAALAAFLITYAMVWTGPRMRGPRLQLAALAITVVTMMVGNYLVVNGLVQQAARKADKTIPRFVGLDLYAKAWGQLHTERDPAF